MADIEAKCIDLFLDNESPPIPFKFDMEDYETCRLNGAIKKTLNQMKVRVPIFQVSGAHYLIGSRVYMLHFDNATDEVMVRSLVEGAATGMKSTKLGCKAHEYKPFEKQETLRDFLS